MVQAERVRLPEAQQLTCWNQILNLACAGSNDSFGIYADSVARDIHTQTLNEDVLADGDGESATKGISEGGNGHCKARM